MADADGDEVCDCEDAADDGQCDYCEDADADGECDCDEVGDDGACVCEDADEDGECDAPRVEVTANGMEHFINTAEEMPRIEFHARLKNADAALKAHGVKDIWFRWHLEMTYDDNHLESRTGCRRRGRTRSSAKAPGRRSGGRWWPGRTR